MYPRKHVMEDNFVKNSRLHAPDRTHSNPVRIVRQVPYQTTLPLQTRLPANFISITECL